MSRKNQDQDIAFYHEHKDDPDIWGEPEERPQTKHRRGLGATITVRFSVEEAEAIRRMAKAAGATYSDIVRQAVQSYTQPRFTIEEGMVYRPFLQQQAHITRAAEEIAMDAVLRGTSITPYTPSTTGTISSTHHPQATAEKIAGRGRSS